MAGQAAFKGLRKDEPANEIAAELPTPIGAGAAPVMGVAISKPDKALWPDAGDDRPVTKRDLADYFAAAGESLLPHVAGRPCSLVRVPDGLGGQQSFQRHVMPGMSNLFDTVKARGDKAPYVEINRIEALIAAA